MRNWWKILAVALLIYTLVMGLTGKVPALAIVHETIRNLYFHVTMWFGMIILFTIGLVYSIRYLAGMKQEHDIIASEAIFVGTLFGTLGLLTGSLWARYTWGAWWTVDPQLNGALAAMLAYFAYVILRGSMDEEQKRARISAVYNIFAYVMMLIFIIIIPKFTDVDSMHPGKGGNPGFNTYDLDSNMRAVFYPAIIGWTLLGLWMMQLRVRIRRLKASGNI
ncbi:MAG: cytochrome c biogenesis protein [Bacteroidota bacterium]